MSIVETLVAKLAAQDQRARGGAPLVGAASPPLPTHRSVCNSSVARASSRRAAGGCSTQRNGIHTVICGAATAIAAATYGGRSRAAQDFAFHLISD
jgi:hypothetical protein